MDNLTPQDLFSPSKAREQRAQAADWAQIDSWLSYKYAGRTVPTFERNPQTLRALRELAAANERADEERIALERVEREACKELEAAVAPDESDALLPAIQTNLTPDGDDALRALGAAAVALNTSTAHPETLAHALIAHTCTVQSLTSSLAHVSTLQAYLDKQHALLRTQLNELRSNPAFTAPPSQARQTTEQARQTKHLRARIREYEDRLSALQSSQPRHAATPASKSVGSAEAIAEMLEQQTALDRLREKVERLEREVDGYAGLPADKDAARKEVAKMEVQLDNARRRRDALFANMIDH